jgi:hypothetical protein
MIGEINMKMLKFLFVFFFVFMTSVTYCKMLTLNDYLGIITKYNNDLNSLQLNMEAIKEKLNETEMVYSCLLSMGINYYVNKNMELHNNQYAGCSDIRKIGYDISIGKQFVSGTQFLFGFNGSGEQYRHTNNLHDMGNYGVSDIVPFIEFQQSLWKNINGRYTKANIAKARANAKSALYLLKYKKQNILLNARFAYWNLSYARKIVDFKKKSLNRTQKILNWNKKRYNMGLIEKSDLLQSQAAVKLGELNLRIAYEEENKAIRVFNQYLNVTDGNVKYDVEKFEYREKDFNISNKALCKKSIRPDVISALEDVKGVLYDQISHQRYTGSDLVFRCHFTLTGLGKSISEAVQHMVNGNRVSYFCGLKYTLPLDFKLRKAVEQGYEVAKIAAQKFAEAAELKENNDWFQIVDNWNNAKLRLELAVEIERIQQQRYEENKYLLKMGRNTTYVVLQSEQALDDARLNVLRNVLELIQIYENVEAFYNYEI